MIVPNLFPTVDPGPVRLAVVGEQPGEAEKSWRHCQRGHGFPGLRFGKPNLRCWCGVGESISTPEPFVGSAGDLLMSLLKDNGLRREQVFLGNVSQLPLRTPDLSECRDDLAVLAADLAAFRPNAVLVMGGMSLEAFKGTDRVSRWRGSITEGTLGNQAYKLVCANNPAAVLYQPSDLCFLRLDVKRAVEEAKTPKLHSPERKFVLHPSLDLIREFLRGLLETPMPIAFDIEGTPDSGVTVCSLTARLDQAFSIPFKRLDWSSVWTPDEESQIWHALRAVMECPRLPKIMHNAAYEQFVLAWLHGIRIQNVEDTMLMWAALYAELDKGLDVLASVLTKEAHWGVAGEWKTDEEQARYNCTDTAVTFECWQAMQPEMTPDARRYYQSQLSLLEPTLDIQLRGVEWDEEAAKALSESLSQECLSAQGTLDAAAGILPPTFEEVAETVTMKVARGKRRVQTWDSIIEHAKPSFREAL